jgi:dihydrolipoamide dehydrogenase
MTDLSCILLVLGAGPGGYVCAIRAAQLGIDTIIVDPQPPGGTCLNVGCIPSKALIHAADEFYKLKVYANQSLSGATTSDMGITARNADIDFEKTLAWKDSIVDRLNHGVFSLFKKKGIKHISGTARFRDGKTVDVLSEAGELRISAEYVVIATGSQAVELPSMPFKGNIISSTEALALPSIPGSLAVVGGGYIGTEIGTAYAKLGTTVTMVEAANGILPQYDTALTRPVVNTLESLGVTLLTNTTVTTYNQVNGVLGTTNEAHGESAFSAEKVLVAVGRKPRLHGWGLSELDLTLDKGFIAIDAQCKTSMHGVYAVGDVTGEPMLAHRAMAQGEMVAEILAGLPREWDKTCIPAVCFTDPEIVSIGASEQLAIEQGIPVVASEFPFRANGRAMSVGREEGFIRVIARTDNHQIIGIQAVGSGISELSAAFSLAIEMGARAEDISATVHAHPTMSESFQEACRKSIGHALHL